jgi:hypothetical protein
MKNTVQRPGRRASATPASVPSTRLIAVLIPATSSDVITASLSGSLSVISPHHRVDHRVKKKIVLKSLNEDATRNTIGVKRNRITAAVHAARAALIDSTFLMRSPA